MDTNNGLPLVAPRVRPVLDPDFRPAILATRAFRALVDATPGAVPVGLALEQADGSVFRFDLAVLPESHPQAAANRTYLERFVKFILWSRGGWRVYDRRPGGAGRSPGEPLSRHRHGTVRRRAGGPADVRPPARGRPHDEPARRAIHDQAAGAAPRGLPHRLRSRRQRSQGRRRHRRPRRVQRRDRVGPVSQAGPAVSLRRHHGLAGQGRRAPAARRCHRRQRRGRLREQPRESRLALPRRAAGPVRRAREGPVPRGPARVARRAVRGRQRRRGDGAGRVDVARQERDPRHRAGDQHRRRLRHRRRQHHVVAQRAGVCAGGLQSGGADRRMVGRLRRRLAVFLAAGRRAAADAGRHRGAGRACRCPRS